MPYRFQFARGDAGAVQENPSQEDENLPADHVLAANVARLMGEQSLQSIREAMAKKQIAIGQGTLAQAKRGHTGTRLATLQKIGAFYGFTVDQLLQRELGATADAWPFAPELYERIARLDRAQRARVERSLVVAVELAEGSILQTEDSATSLLEKGNFQGGVNSVTQPASKRLTKG